MLFSETGLHGSLVIDLERHADERGYFARTLCEKEFLRQGLPAHFPQCNISHNTRRGTLRGMHYERPPTNESKLVRCVSGAIHDVIVDLRRDSPTRLRSFAVELSAENGRALFIPAGFAHGFLTLADATSVFYHMGDFYRPDAARGFRWSDPRFELDWPARPTTLSERDATYPDFDLGAFDAEAGA